ncbi:MAG: hypothetical protein JXB45_10575 [Candidatus Krumholzibacteriota bacterium]|nr:hypothetical protein [Candidatus Krumholzibacteriota bacterium]
MKKLLMIFLVVMILSPGAQAQKGTIGLFADVAHSSWCASNPAPPNQYFVTMYIFAFPTINGFRSAEFAVSYPDHPDFFALTWTPNPDNVLTKDNLVDGYSITFDSCPTDAFELGHQLLLIRTADPLELHPIPAPNHPGATTMFLAACAFPYLLDAAYPFTSLFLNYNGTEAECGATDTEPASWGAIKGMYRE